MNEWLREFDETWKDFFGGERLPRRLVPLRNDISELFSYHAPEIKETENDITYRLVVPDMQKTDFKISAKDGYLSIQAKKEEKQEEDGVTYHTKSFSSRGYYRHFPLPENADTTKIDASYDSNVLQVVVEKISDYNKDKGKTIEVK